MPSHEKHKTDPALPHPRCTARALTHLAHLGLGLCCGDAADARSRAPKGVVGDMALRRFLQPSPAVLTKEGEGVPGERVGTGRHAPPASILECTHM